MSVCCDVRIICLRVFSEIFFSNVTTLNVETNYLRNFKLHGHIMQNVCEITLLQNLFTDIPPDLVLLPNLTYLNMNRNHVNRFSNVVSQFPRLITLSLCSCGMQSLNAACAQISTLQKLIVTDNMLIRVPSELGLSRSLKIIDVSRNKDLDELPESIANIDTIQELHAVRCGITNIKLGLLKIPVVSLEGNPITRGSKMSGASADIPGTVALQVYARNQHAESSLELDLSRLGLSDLNDQMVYQMVTYLDLSFNTISTLPDFFGNILELRTFKIAHNCLTDLPSVVACLSKISTLDLSYNALNFFPPQLIFLKAMQQLVLEGNNCVVFDERMPKVMLQMLTLDCRECHITSIPESFGMLTNLVSMNFSNNVIKYLPSSIETCISLTRIEMCCCDLRRIPDSVAHCTSLQQILINSNPIESLCKALLKLSALTQLEIQNCPILFPFIDTLCVHNAQSLQMAFDGSSFQRRNGLVMIQDRGHTEHAWNQIRQFDTGSATQQAMVGRCNFFKELQPHHLSVHLKFVDVSWNPFQHIPSAIWELPFLEVFVAEHCNISSWTFSEEHSPTSIQTLSLSHNNMDYIPFWIGRCLNLKVFGIYSNPVPTLWNHVNSVGISKLQHILKCGDHLFRNKVIDLRKIGLRQFPACLGKNGIIPESITQLYLSNNHLSIVPEAVIHFTSLSILDISDNKIMRLPAHIWTISTMEYLNASHNQIEDIPGGIIDCQLLEKIDFSFNPIKELPIELKNHALMTFISIRNTKISDISCISSIISLEEVHANECLLEEITAEWNVLPNLTVFQVNSETLRFEKIHKSVVDFVSADFVDYSVSAVLIV
jgi:leucine-rich repeat protein SHOC2